ncbi:MAG: hypothetical protein AB1640_00725 [bacterium]
MAVLLLLAGDGYATGERRPGGQAREEPLRICQNLMDLKVPGSRADAEMDLPPLERPAEEAKGEEEQAVSADHDDRQAAPEARQEVPADRSGKQGPGAPAAAATVGEAQKPSSGAGPAPSPPSGSDARQGAADGDSALLLKSKTPEKYLTHHEEIDKDLIRIYDRFYKK